MSPTTIEPPPERGRTLATINLRRLPSGQYTIAVILDEGFFREAGPCGTIQDALQQAGRIIAARLGIRGWVVRGG